MRTALQRAPDPWGSRVKSILGVWAHPDDEAFLAGGLMVAAVRRGARVACIHMTRGEAGLIHGEPCHPATLAPTRERELRTSLDRLGVTEQLFYGYPDGGLDAVSAPEPVARIVDALLDLRPDAVVTFGPDGFTGHRDHRVLSAWVSAAFARWRDPKACLYQVAISLGWTDMFASAPDEFDFFWPGHPIVDGAADVTLELDGEVLDAKVAALRAHSSQMQPLFEAYGEEFMRVLARTECFRVARAPSTKG